MIAKEPNLLYECDLKLELRCAHKLPFMSVCGNTVLFVVDVSMGHSLKLTVWHPVGETLVSLRTIESV